MVKVARSFMALGVLAPVAWWAELTTVASPLRWNAAEGLKVLRRIWRESIARRTKSNGMVFRTTGIYTMDDAMPF